MALKFNCPDSSCRQRIEVVDALAGTEISCPQCSAKVHVPKSHDIRFTCRTAECDQHLVVDVSEAGRFVKCPACGKPQRVPGDPPKTLYPEPVTAKSATQPAILSGKQKTFALSRLRGIVPQSFSRSLSLLRGVASNWFIPVAGGVLALSGILKAWSLSGGGGFLAITDPVLGVRSGMLMLVAGIVEMAVAGVCLFTNANRMAGPLVAWLATNILVYRLGLMWMGWSRPCHCLGHLTSGLGVSPQTADMISLAMLAYLLIGSYALLLRQGRQGRGTGEVAFQPAA